MSESLGLASHKSSCNCTGCGMLRAGVCINCAEKTTALILESNRGELAVASSIVSKRLGSPYRSGRSKDWLKFKNPDAPAAKREAEEDWRKGRWK